VLRLACPFCGPRDEIEFRYRGDATLRRPSGNGDIEAFAAHVFDRANPDGWHLEWWQHIHGCRSVFRAKRHVLTHEVAWIGRPGETPP
jgi:sarcosine oxidase subunit delta